MPRREDEYIYLWLALFKWWVLSVMFILIYGGVYGGAGLNAEFVAPCPY